MSKVLYTQQLGRGMRLYEGKKSLMVFDFVGNASQYNAPYSLHRLFKLKEYQPGKLAVAPSEKRAAEDDLYAKGEKPDAPIDWPVDATDYEVVDIFNWQEEAAGMISQKDATRNILSNPFKRFEDMQMMRHTKTLGIVQVDESVWKHLNKEEKAEIEKICEDKPKEYYSRLENRNTF